MATSSKQTNAEANNVVQPPKSRKSLIGLGVIVVIVVLLLAGTKIASQYANDHIAHPTTAVADKYAQTAATVMERNNIERPTAAAAYDVVGTTSTTTITALKATGTTYNGEVILRIDVTDSSGILGSTDHTERCYAYYFHHSADAIQPDRLSRCPSSAPLKLSAPVSVNLPNDSQTLLQNTLNALSTAQRVDPSMIESAVTAKFPSPLTVWIDGSTTDGYSIFIQASSTECISATISPSGVATANPEAHGTDCMGG